MVTYLEPQRRPHSRRHYIRVEERHRCGSSGGGALLDGEALVHPTVPRKTGSAPRFAHTEHGRKSVILSVHRSLLLARLNRSLRSTSVGIGIETATDGEFKIQFGSRAGNRSRSYIISEKYSQNITLEHALFKSEPQPVTETKLQTRRRAESKGETGGDRDRERAEVEHGRAAEIRTKSMDKQHRDQSSKRGRDRHLPTSRPEFKAGPGSSSTHIETGSAIKSGTANGIATGSWLKSNTGVRLKSELRVWISSTEIRVQSGAGIVIYPHRDRVSNQKRDRERDSDRLVAETEIGRSTRSSRSRQNGVKSGQVALMACTLYARCMHALCTLHARFMHASNASKESH
ncbi:hypothetical protein EVAR_92943_1 [Eumeta japonica]|uniref:Uncharacterized protein n=1 Tax=Eumeta variegata TaxID=151549 RepID=A0A4C1TAG3_EUMVA|nr:hypothetical protein EVAR_92943_1 [Eumeta japonica]